MPLYIPAHSQEQIQDIMIELWLKNYKNDQDKLRANYVSNYKNNLGGWCDGWSYALSVGTDDVSGEDLADIWKEIDNYLSIGTKLSLTSQYKAYTLARCASLYHIINNPAPANGSQQDLDYKAARYDLEHKPMDRETWKHDEYSTLEIYVIKAEAKSLSIGHTLRLTSPVHDAAIKCIKNGFIVSETEKHGVQKCNTLEEVMLIINEWQQECKNTGIPFFNQSMVK